MSVYVFYVYVFSGSVDFQILDYVKKWTLTRDF